MIRRDSEEKEFFCKFVSLFDTSATPCVQLVSGRINFDEHQ